MHLLALEPFYGGSHRAFLDGWREHSHHRFSLCTLSAHHWKWRMRQSSILFAQQAVELAEQGEEFDLLWCSDMVSLAELVGLLPERLRALPRVLYFHENQLTYPVRDESERDRHFALTNLTSALAADEIWFNSAFHRDSFLAALPGLVKPMPPPRPRGLAQRLAARCRVEWPGVETGGPERSEASAEQPLRLVWVSRWEHDKNPETFFEALSELRRRDVDFRLSVLGERFRSVPEVFERAYRELGEVIDVWGFQESRADYLEVLSRSDVVVSTALHEFFGIAVVEAVLCGAYPVLPQRLSYPELLTSEETHAPDLGGFFYEGTAQSLAERLEQVAAAKRSGTLDATAARSSVARFRWQRRAPELDRSLEALRNGVVRGRAATAARS